MKTLCLVLLAAITSLYAQKQQTCTTGGANFTVADYLPGMSSDGGGSYINSEQGVIGRINCNGQSLELSGTRHTYLSLGTPINGTAPSWAASPAPVAFFNIPLGKFFNNAEPNPTDFSFTTYLDITMGSPNLGYYFSMQNPTESAGLSAPTKGVNTPLVTTLVNVIHYGATPTAPETWVVTPASISPIGTLMSNLKGGLGEVGQFYLPFSITVTRQ
jgi:hypothetical protein